MGLPENHIRIGVLAKVRTKLRRKSIAHPTWYADWINSRDPMRCKETRNKKHGSYYEPTYIIEPEVIRELPPHEMLAYQAKMMDNKDAQEPLYLLILEIVVNLCEREQWSFNHKKNNSQLECLASLLLHEFLVPARFRKKNTDKPVFAISALANEMHMNRKTYNVWHRRFLIIRPFIRKWYEDGVARIEYR